jgi:hypothetical protein
MELLAASMQVKKQLGCKVRVNYLCYENNTTELDIQLLARVMSEFPELALQLSQPNGGLLVGGLSKEKMVDLANILKALIPNRIVLFFSAKREDEKGGCGTLTYR